MTPMQSIEHLSSAQIEKLIAEAQKENDELRQRVTDSEETIEQLQDENAALRGENRQLKLEMEAVGAGGVSLMGSRS